MDKITLYTYRSGMYALLELIPLSSQYSNKEALNTLSLEEITLVEWRVKFTPKQLLTWHLRDYNKPYAVKLPLSVAVALWQVLQRVPRSVDLLEVSDMLYRELINNGLKPNYQIYSPND